MFGLNKNVLYFIDVKEFPVQRNVLQFDVESGNVTSEQLPKENLSFKVGVVNSSVGSDDGARIDVTYVLRAYPFDENDPYDGPFSYSRFARGFSRLGHSEDEDNTVKLPEEFSRSMNRVTESLDAIKQSVKEEKLQYCPVYAVARMYDDTGKFIGEECMYITTEMDAMSRAYTLNFNLLIRNSIEDITPCGERGYGYLRAVNDPAELTQLIKEFFTRRMRAGLTESVKPRNVIPQSRISLALGANVSKLYTPFGMLSRQWLEEGATSYVDVPLSDLPEVDGLLRTYIEGLFATPRLGYGMSYSMREFVMKHQNLALFGAE